MGLRLDAETVLEVENKVTFLSLPPIPSSKRYQTGTMEHGHQRSNP